MPYLGLCQCDHINLFITLLVITLSSTVVKKWHCGRDRETEKQRNRETERQRDGETEKKVPATETK